MMEFQKAVRKQAKARVAISGPAGAGKTYTALILAKLLASGGKVAVIDTERQSASLYADEFDFDVLELETFSPSLYEQGIHAAEQAGYSVILIDSMSHAWEGAGGFLDQKGRLEDQRGYNSWTAWRKMTPMHEQFIDAMLRSKCHMIVTLRAKMEYEQVKGEDGKVSVQKIGMAPVARNGAEYEFTIFADMDVDHSISISKTRCKPMTDRRVQLPDTTFWQPFVDWLNSGEEPTLTPPPEPEPEKQQPETQAQPTITEYPDTPEEIITSMRLASKKYYSKYKDEPPATNQYTLFISLLSSVADGDDVRRITFLREVWQIEKSSKEMSRRQIMASLDWLNPEEYAEGNKQKYRVGNPNAVNEFNLVVNAAVQRGMEPLPGIEELPEELEESQAELAEAEAIPY